MAFSVALLINGSIFAVELNTENKYIIREDDELSITITLHNSSIKPLIFFEDAEPELSCVSDAAGFVYSIPTVRYFAECFGQTYIRVYIEELVYSIFFDVRAKKINAEQAAKMITYLATHHESLIKSCFSRSTLSVGSTEEGKSDPESIIAAAEGYVTGLLNHRTELMATKRTRLIPTRMPLWKANRINCDIDPLDILNNLDDISPTNIEGDLFLRGRHFTIGEIDVSALNETANVQENQILLGGLYSIRGKLQILLINLDRHSLTPASTDGYESFDRLLLSLTSFGMVKRCLDLMDKTAELIRLFESHLGVSYIGDIRPVMTPYARTSKVYRSLYTYLATWYALGMPSFGANHFLLKLKSLSKIYEIYSFFQLIEHMYNSGWEGIGIKMHPELGEFHPQEATLKRENILVKVTYEQVIRPFDRGRTQHLSLVDVQHRLSGAFYNYWKPDFVMRLDSDSGKTKYIILDAKYSTAYSVREYHLPEVINKYYWGMSVYNATLDVLTNEQIAGVLVIYPLGVSSSFLHYGKRKSIGSKNLPLPVIGATGLVIDQTESFGRVMEDVISSIIKTLH